MAEFIMKDMVSKAGLDVFVASAATSTEEIGNGVHHGTRRILDRLGISYAGKQAVQMTKADYDKYDYIIGMDSANIRNIKAIAGGDENGKVVKLLSLAGEDRDVADPWYTGDFEQTYEDVVKGCSALIETLKLTMR